MVFWLADYSRLCNEHCGATCYFVELVSVVSSGKCIDANKMSCPCHILDRPVSLRYFFSKCYYQSMIAYGFITKVIHCSIKVEVRSLSLWV
jgi:hypothetical protein